jgi:hypothetical protein
MYIYIHTHTHTHIKARVGNFGGKGRKRETRDSLDICAKITLKWISVTWDEVLWSLFICLRIGTTVINIPIP